MNIRFFGTTSTFLVELLGRALRGAAWVWLVLGVGSVAMGQTNWVWQPMPMVAQSTLNAGYYPGGEGCQYPQLIAVDGQDGSFLLYGTDVGGMYRSTDGGHTFQPCNINLETCGAVGFAIDPRNKDRCLAVGDGGGNQYNVYGGVYLSTNRGATWSRVCSKWLDAVGGGYYWSAKGREQIAFDPSSYNASLGYCTVAYWVEEGNPQEPCGRLYKSLDGGQTWSLKATQDKYGGDDDAHSLLKVHPSLGYIYVANQVGHNGTNQSGLYRSTDGGTSFARVLSGNFLSLDAVASAPTNVWTATTNRIFLSSNSGASFSSFSASGVANLKALKVSPANSQNMMAADMNSNSLRLYSTNGGANWYACGKDMSLSWIPPSILYDDRNSAHVWHPTNANTAWCIGPGDLISTTTNRGLLLQWANNGNNGIMLGGGFNFNPQNPSLLYFGSQDYNGARTTNGGATWDFINLSVSNTDGDPWGWVYGAYAASSLTLFGGNKAYGASTYELWITFNGGQSSLRKVSNLTGLQVCYGDPTDPKVLFCWSYRSTDGGTNWTQMTGCQGVFTHSPADNTLYGANGAAVVKSTDKGATWTTVTTLSANVSDIAINHLNGRLWVVANNALYKCDPPGYAPVQVAQPNGNATSVAVDRQNPSWLYVAGTPGTWRKTFNTVVRSTDSGISWSSLVNRSDLVYDGGNCASWVRVHPATRDLWVGTVCYGMWRFGSSPVITNPPSARTANAGQSATFQVGVNGLAPFAYQWCLNGTNLPGATSSSLTLPYLQPTEAGNYSVLVTNLAGATNSVAAVLTVNVPPGISAQPQGLAVTQGSNATFSVSANGLPAPAYQWLFNGTNLDGASSSTFTRSNAQPADAGAYSVVVSNVAGSLLSSNALLVVVQPPPQLASTTVLPGGQFQFLVNGAGGHYSVQAATNLADWFELTNFFTSLPAFSFVDTETNLRARFYRVRLSP